MNEELMSNLHLMLGRLNGLHAAVVAIAASLPPAAAQAAATTLREGAERVHADALASLVSDLQVNEMQRVTGELVRVLEAAAALQ